MKSIGLSNFRCFDHTGDIEIKPLTVLVGANASGKSSFLKIFPLLKQTIGRRHEGVFIWYDPNGVDFNNMANVVRHGKKSITLKLVLDRVVFRNYYSRTGGLASDVHIELGFCLDKKCIERIEFLKLYLFNYSIKITYNNKGNIRVFVNGKQVVIQNEVNLVKSDSLLPRFVYISENESGKGNSVSFSHPSDIIKTIEDSYVKPNKKSSNPDADLSRWMNWIPTNWESLSKYLGVSSLPIKQRDKALRLYIVNNLNEILNSINRYIMLITQSITYIGPLRVTAARYNRDTNLSINEISPNGDNLASLLSSLSPSRLNELKKWTEENFGFIPDVSKRDGIIELSVKPKDSERFYNLSDIGFGYTQLLPIIVGIWQAQERSIPSITTNSLIFKNEHIICIEQPELHIHPKMQKQFVELLVKIITSETIKNKFKFIIETHSQTIINAIGQAVRNKNLDKNKVSILLFEEKISQVEKADDKDNGRTERKSNITVADFDDKGYLSKWPYGFLN